MPFQNTDQSQKRVCLGKIIAAHGVKGLVKILPFGDDPTLLGGTLYTDESSENVLSITLKNPIGKYILAEIEGITERNGAQDIRGTELFVSKETLPDIEDGDGFYYEDLAGLDVIENDKNIGKVIAVDNFGAGDLLEIQPISGNSFYLPYTDNYVVEVDLEKKSVIVQNHEEMILE